MKLRRARSTSPRSLLDNDVMAQHTVTLRIHHAEEVCEEGYTSDGSEGSHAMKGHSSKSRITASRRADRRTRWGKAGQWAIFLFGFALTGSFFLRNTFTMLHDQSLRATAVTMEDKLEPPRTIVSRRNMPLALPNSPSVISYSEAPARIRPWPGVIERRMERETPQLVQHEICGGCRLGKIKSGGSSMTCGLWMHQQMKKNKEMTIRDAGNKVSKQFPKECKRCDPAACSPQEKEYWPLDVAAPHVIASRSLRLTVPSEYRIPENAFGNLDNFFAKEENQHPFLFEWNPSIIVLPQDQIPDRLKDVDLQDVPVYLASFRVTKQQNCFRTSHSFHQHIGVDSPHFKTDFVDLAGIALLREDFSIVEEGLFDLRNVIKRDQDMRLFVFPPEEGSEESRIYISAFHEVSRLWLKPPKDTRNKRVFYDYFEKNANPLAIILEDRASCCTACRGKNFNYFLDHRTKKIVVETLPMAPHTVEDMDFASDCESSAKKNAFKSTAVEDLYVPQPSFSNTDELYFMDKGIFNLPYSPEHGTACCVHIPDPRNEGKELLVGVSHSKTMLAPEEKTKLREAGVDSEARQYISRFYAFEPQLPYRVVALSGGFCMPFPTEDEFAENYNNKLVKKRPYQLGSKIGCPYITFLSGITDKANDPSKVLISYGLNDCTNRIAEVSKKEIIQILFDPLSRLDSTLID